MRGINLDRQVTYLHGSLRYFNKNERHVTRVCADDVLVMVFDGILRFSEDGVCYEIKAGEYFIQEKNLFQEGYAPSDSPKYLYVHFSGSWDEGDFILPKRGIFDCEMLMGLMEEMDRLAHGNFSYVKRCGIFCRLLCELNNKSEKQNTANKIAMFIENEDLRNITLNEICNKFNFSKNHIINIFKKEYGVTPVNYINEVKLKRAKYLLEVTSHTIEDVASESGFSDYSHFYKLFCRENGMSPVQWRKKVQGRVGE